MSHPELQAASKKMHATAQELSTMLSTLRGQVQEVRAAWIGQSGVSFENILAAWDANARVLNERITDIADAVVAGSQKAQIRDDTTAQELQRVQQSSSVIQGLT